MLDKVMKFTNKLYVLLGIVAVVLCIAGYAWFTFNGTDSDESFITDPSSLRQGELPVRELAQGEPELRRVLRRVRKQRRMPRQPRNSSGGVNTTVSNEGFSDSRTCNSKCGSCGKSKSTCGCNRASGTQSSLVMGSRPAPIAPCPRVMEPDLSKYILKSQVPSCSRGQMPEMSNYMLKTECPPVPDLSKYILKSSIPKPQPVIIDNSKCKTDSGECPPCPRPRCPVVKCPPPTKCPPPAPCPRAVCPPTVVKCKSEESYNPTVRPFLAPLNSGIFGNS